MCVLGPKKKITAKSHWGVASFNSIYWATLAMPWGCARKQSISETSASPHASRRSSGLLEMRSTTGASAPEASQRCVRTPAWGAARGHPRGTAPHRSSEVSYRGDEATQAKRPQAGWRQPCTETSSVWYGTILRHAVELWFITVPQVFLFLNIYPEVRSGVKKQKTGSPDK